MARHLLDRGEIDAPGVTSSPPTERGSSSRNSRASCSADSSAGGRRRVRSISSDAAAIGGPQRAGAGDRIVQKRIGALETVHAAHCG